MSEEKIYCGNNRRHPDIISKVSKFGTRYQCLRKGIGKGMSMGIDNDYIGDYEPYDNRRVYCGNSPTLPDTHDIMGNGPMCLQKGIGIGKSIAAKKSISGRNMFIIFIVLVVVSLIVVILNIIEKNRQKHRKKIEDEKIKLENNHF